MSNIKCFSKIIEKAVIPRLNSHLHENCLQEPYQSAYKAKHGTETALLKVKNDILCAIDNQRAASLVLLDLSAAFDTIDYSILLDRLSHTLKITSTPLHWISSYLTGRTSRVCISGTYSDQHNLDFGLPQGSVLGPSMFSNYTYPLGQIITRHGLNYHMYADDTQIYIDFNPRIPGDCAVALFKLQTCINDIKKWMNTNKLKLNEEKT